MNLTENAQKWTDIISESLKIENKSKLAWMSQYAANHEMYEAVQAGDHSAGIYSTPLNTLGMGNPQMPEPANGYQRGTGIGNTGVDFHNQKVGSGDIPMSTLTMSLEIAAMTIGLELVPVIPASGPWAMLSYMDFPYAGGKLGKLNETSMDGKGEDDSNKPIYIRIKTDRDIQITAKSLNQGDPVKVLGSTKALDATYIGNSRLDNSIIVRVLGCGTFSGTTVTADSNTSIADVFDQTISAIVLGTVGYYATSGTDDSTHVYLNRTINASADFVSGAADHVQGFANFYGTDVNHNALNPDPMTRAENETGVGNTIGARMFTRLIQMGSYEVTGSVTRQQLQDMPLYGVDVVGKVLEAMQNEISQHINNRILDRVFKLGVENAKTQYDYQKVDLNLYFGASSSSQKNLSAFGAAKYLVDLNGIPATDTTTAGWSNGWVVKNATQNTAAENTHTHQRRIMSRCLAAANLIANVSRFGRGQWIVTNTQVLSALQDCAGFVVAPMTNTLTQDGSNSLYFAGSVAGLQVYVDPYMTWDDTRICVGRKSDGNTPGVIFMPYILADTVQTIVEGTMAPKLLVNSRFAIVDAGFHTDQNYFTFAVDAEGAYFI